MRTDAVTMRDESVLVLSLSVRKNTEEQPISWIENLPGHNGCKGTSNVGDARR